MFGESFGLADVFVPLRAYHEKRLDGGRDRRSSRDVPDGKQTIRRTVKGQSPPGMLEQLQRSEFVEITAQPLLDYLVALSRAEVEKHLLEIIPSPNWPQAVIAEKWTESARISTSPMADALKKLSEALRLRHRSGATRNWTPIGPVVLNSGRTATLERMRLNTFDGTHC